MGYRPPPGPCRGSRPDDRPVRSVPRTRAPPAGDPRLGSGRLPGALGGAEAGAASVRPGGLGGISTVNPLTAHGNGALSPAAVSETPALACGSPSMFRPQGDNIRVCPFG